MKTYLFTTIILMWTLNAACQNCAEFEKHLASIDSAYYPGHIIDRMDTVFNANRAFVDYTIENLLDKPSDKCFISNRNILRKLKTIACDDSKVIISDTLKNGEFCVISFIIAPFQAKNHQFITNNDTSTIKKIDGQYPFGGEYGIPEMEIGRIQIAIGGIKVTIPEEAYQNLYNPRLCDAYGHIRPIEAYESLDGKYIYLYLNGGVAASSYFAKLVFDKTKFITKIVSDYYTMSIHGSFRESFIGF